VSAYHLRELWNECDENSCRSQKKVSLYNWQNSHMGDYCRKHGTERLKRYTREHEMDQRRTS